MDKGICVYSLNSEGIVQLRKRSQLVRDVVLDDLFLTVIKFCKLSLSKLPEVGAQSYGP